MIIANNLKKIYGKDFVSVDDLSFHIKKGEIVGFVGQNGAGKTTTIKMLTGILKPTEGNVRINGHDIRKEPLEAKQSTRYLFTVNRTGICEFYSRYLWCIRG